MINLFPERLTGSFSELTSDLSIRVLTSDLGNSIAGAC